MNRAIGATDELGFAAVEDRVHVSDLHAPILHLMGLDQKLTSGTHQAQVVKKALA